mgnify:CR=1 FL=1
MRMKSLKSITYLAPTEIAHMATHHLISGPTPALHDHDFYEVFWVDSGQVRHITAQGEATLSSGTMTFSRPEDAHALKATGPQATKITNLMLRSSEVDRLRSIAPEAVKRYWSDALQPHQISQTTRYVLAALSPLLGPGPTAARAPLHGLLLSVFAALDQGPSWPETAPKWLTDALSQPEIMIDGAKGLFAIAPRSTPHVCRIVQQHFGKSPSALINEMRINQAAQRLLQSQDPIDNVARDVGFETPGYFYRLFRAQTGESPRSYRLRMRSPGLITP